MRFSRRKIAHWVAARLRDAASGQVSGPHETAWRIAGGKTRRVSWTLRPLQGPNGEIQYLIVSGQDVTDQRQIEKALHSSEARYREVVENSLGFVFTCSLGGPPDLPQRVHCGDPRLSHRSSHRPRGRPSCSTAPATPLSTSASMHSRPAKSGKARLPLRRSDGVYRRIAFRSRRMQLPGERPFVLIHGIDVTEQHEAEQALHMATRQRELILESVGDGIYGIDLEGRSPSSTRPAPALSATPRRAHRPRSCMRLSITATPTARPTPVPPAPSFRRCAAANPSACATKSSGATTDRLPGRVQRQPPA